MVNSESKAHLSKKQFFIYARIYMEANGEISMAPSKATIRFREEFIITSNVKGW
ncbi:MAG: hypothetical protein ACFFD4_15775 [Candidatus Odinarchaeota archaeon]